MTSGSWLPYIFSILSGVLIASGIWSYAKAIFDSSGTLLLWIVRFLGIFGLGAAFWFAERHQIVGIIAVFFGASVLALGTAWLARKTRMR